MTFNEIEDAVGTIELFYRDQLKAEVFDKLTDEQLFDAVKEMRAQGFQWQIRFVAAAESELGHRRNVRRAREVGALIYCVWHDCDATKCPKDGVHDDE